MVQNQVSQLKWLECPPVLMRRAYSPRFRSVFDKPAFGAASHAIAH